MQLLLIHLYEFPHRIEEDVDHYDDGAENYGRGSVDALLAGVQADLGGDRWVLREIQSQLVPAEGGELLKGSDITRKVKTLPHVAVLTHRLVIIPCPQLNVVHHQRGVDGHKDQEYRVDEQVGQVKVLAVRVPLHLQILLAQRMRQQLHPTVGDHCLAEIRRG